MKQIKFAILALSVIALSCIAFSFTPQPPKQGHIKPATVQDIQRYIQAVNAYMAKRPYEEAAPYVQGAYQLQQMIEADLRDTTTIK